MVSGQDGSRKAKRPKYRPGLQTADHLPDSELALLKLWYGSRCLLGARACPALIWSQLLPQPLMIPTVMTLRTLDDVRQLLRHLPQENRSNAAWRYVASQLDKAAVGKLRTVDVEIALRLVLMLEGVKCRSR
jgi:hypothetical protein